MGEQRHKYICNGLITSLIFVLMNKILCPVDFSSTSINALEFAVEIGKKYHSQLTLVHIFTESEFNKIVGEEAVGKSFKALLAMAENKLASLAGSIMQDGPGLVKCEYRVELGELTDMVNEIVTAENYDVVIMGTSGISQTDGVFFGSNTEHVIEKVKAPILCVPGNATYTEFKKIVYASDFMKEDRVAIQKVISLATLFDSRINVLHINVNNDESEYQHFVEELKSFVQYDKISFVNKKYNDDISIGINEYINQENADLLVVFRKQRGFVETIFHKSLTKVLSFSTEKPLYVLKLDSN